MKSAEILNWLGLKQGSARKKDIQILWSKTPEYEQTIFVAPGSNLESIGLQAGNTTTQSNPPLSP